jgi:hypothetical protein
MVGAVDDTASRLETKNQAPGRIRKEERFLVSPKFPFFRVFDVFRGE